MHLIRHDDLRIALGVALTVLKPHVKKTAGLVDGAQEAVLDAVMNTLSPYLIVSPELIAQQYRLGRFGVDEPHPFPDLIDEHGVPRVPGFRVVQSD